MVVYTGVPKDRNKVNQGSSTNPKSDGLSTKKEDCNVGEVASKKSNPSISFSRSSKARIQISTGSQPQNIGLRLNTNVLYKPKKKLNYKDVLLTLLLGFLVFQGIINYLQTHEIRERLDLAERNLELLDGNLDMINELVDQVLEKVKKLEVENAILKSSSHLIVKREIESQISANSTREARAVGRGKHSHCKNRHGGRSRCVKTSGPLSVHLKGALPEISVRDGGIIAPWYIDKAASGIFNLADGVVGERRGVVEIVEEGLYFIYAQMYYLTSSSLNSYAINLQVGEGRGREESVVAVCSAEAANNKLSELSCFTAVVRYLSRGDRIYVTQRERNRRIIFRDNKSFLGLTLLNSLNK